MQNPLSMILYLDDPVPEFTFRERHAEYLAAKLPTIDLIAVHSLEELHEKLPHADYVAAWEFPSAAYLRAPRLKAVFTPAAGRERVSPDPRGIVPTLYGTFHGRLMAESFAAMMLYFNRRFWRVVQNQREHRWERSVLAGSRALRGQRVLIVGYGHIGRACGEMAAALGCSVVGVRRSPSAERAGGPATRVVSFVDLGRELAEADHLLAVLPGTLDTDGIITPDHLRAIKPGACFYNLGRGNCCREDALVEALTSGPLAGAGLDVFADEPLRADSPLWGLPNVLIMPHASAIFREYMDLFVEEVVNTLRSRS